MDTNIKNYIESGTNMVLDFKQYITVLFGPAVFLPINLLVGIVLGNSYKIFSIVMMSTCLLIVFTGLFLYRKKSIVFKLWCQAFIIIHFILQLITIQTICFVMTYGLQFILILLYFPILLVPTVLTFVHQRMIKKNALIVQKTSVAWRNGLIGCCAGWIGYRLVRFTHRAIDISQNDAVWLVLLLVLLLNSILSVGLLNFHKIYLCKKFDFTGEGSLIDAH